MCYSSQNIRSQANCSQESDAHLLTLSAPIIPRPLVVSLSLFLLPSSSFFPPLPTHLESPTFFFCFSEQRTLHSTSLAISSFAQPIK